MLTNISIFIVIVFSTITLYNLTFCLYYSSNHLTGFPHSTFAHASTLLGLSRWHYGKESACQCKNHRRPGFDPWIGRTPGEGNGNPPQYSGLENPMNRGAWLATAYGIAKNQT